MGKTLTKQQARSLLISEPRRTATIPVWPKEDDRKLLHDAVQSKKKTVVFSNGRKFKILYSKSHSIAWGDYDSVFVSPEKGFVPCGWFHVKFILRGPVF